MYPQGKLSELAAYKAAVQRKIGRRREQWRTPAVVVARPLVWLDQIQDVARRLSPWIKYGAVPLGFLLRRRLFAPFRLLGPVLRWSPLIFSAVRGMKVAAAALPRDRGNRVLGEAKVRQSVNRLR